MIFNGIITLNVINIIFFFFISFQITNFIARLLNICIEAIRKYYDTHSIDRVI